MAGKYEAKQQILQHVAEGNDVFTATDVGVSGVTLSALYQTGFVVRVGTTEKRKTWLYRVR
jgi:hypothetical protein